MPKFKKIIRSPWFIAIGSLVLAFLLYAEFNQLKTTKDIDKEISDLKKQADSLQKNNQQLAGFIEYFKTDSYKEKVAREQLNLKKAGEVVYSFSDSQSSADSEAGSVAGLTTSAKETAPDHFKQWINYFFGKK